MNDRSCFVQFIHPGGEHRPDRDDLKGWNSGPHRRKFLKSPGRYHDRTGTHEAELVFWGEWEPQSAVVARLNGSAPGDPRFLYEPYYSVPRSRGGWQNTDPFVFGDHFIYTGCLQHTKKGATQLRHLLPGSVILFGSCMARSRFVIDTVFVVADYLDHSKDNWRRQLEGKVSETYKKVTMEHWYQGCVPERQTFRLYFGATPETPVNGMFSFSPCQPYSSATSGFKRPSIELPGHITPTMTQSKKITHDSSEREMQMLWARVVDQVQEQGLCLGTHAALPPAAAPKGLLSTDFSAIATKRVRC